MKKTLVTRTASGVIIAAVLALAPLAFAQSNTSGSLNGTTDTIEVTTGGSGENVNNIGGDATAGSDCNNDGVVNEGECGMDDNNGTVTNTNVDDANVTSEYWTPERMREAKPMDATVGSVNADGSVNGENPGFFDWVAGWNVWNIFGNGNDDGCGENGKLCPNQIGDDNGGNSNGGNLDDCGTNGKLCPNQIGDGNDGNDGNINGGGNNDGNINDNGTNDDGGPTNTTNIDASSGVNAGGEAPSSFSFSALLRNLIDFFGF